MEWKDISQRVLTKGPDEVLDYVFDWAPKTNERPNSPSDWLEDGETIDDKEITVAGIDGIGAQSARRAVEQWNERMN